MNNKRHLTQKIQSKKGIRKLKKNALNNKMSESLRKEILLEEFWNIEIHGNSCLNKN